MAEINLDLTQTRMTRIITHHIGNKLKNEKAQYSEVETRVESESVDYLMRYFLSSFKPEEFFSFKDIETNEMNKIAPLLFAERKNYIENSNRIASLLFECNHQNPRIKATDLNISYFEDMVLGDEVMDAIGIFSTEAVDPFLKFNNLRTKYSINHDYGIPLKKIDRACLIFNTNEDNGYKILVIDNTTKNPLAQFWKTDFLVLEPINNEFNQTNHYLGLSKSFVTEIINEDLEISKTDQIELLNRSLEYFQSRDKFDKKEFEDEVFQVPEIIESFRNYDDNIQINRELNINKNFDISPLAVRKQAKVFKSVLKLDKNFHIYIHGSKDLIEQGTDDQGRKYYKIYYENEA